MGEGGIEQWEINYLLKYKINLGELLTCQGKH